MPAARVVISEVGPRDGLQNAARCRPTAAKRAWIDALHAAGLREIEVGSFVPPRLLPQMADVAEVARHALTLPGLTVMALVPNAVGAADALAAGVHELTISLSASAAHSLANLRKTPEQMLDELPRIVALRDELAPGVHVEVGLSDTTGMADPEAARRLVQRLRAAIGPKAGAAQLHNTRGLGLANCLAACDVGVCTFDASQGGLRGCPCAPGASANVVTEDLVFMFEAMGVATGVDLHALVAARQALLVGLPGEPLYGMLPEAGLPKGCTYAEGRLPPAAAFLASWTGVV